jgi:hypothetical protein
LRPHCRIVSCVTEMPRAASISSTMQAQREPKIQPYRVADDLSGVAMAGVNRVSRRPHPARLPDQPGSYQACSRGQLDGACGTTCQPGFPAVPLDQSLNSPGGRETTAHATSVG